MLETLSVHSPKSEVNRALQFDAMDLADRLKAAKRSVDDYTQLLSLARTTAPREELPAFYAAFAVAYWLQGDKAKAFAAAKRFQKARPPTAFERAMDRLKGLNRARFKER